MILPSTNRVPYLDLVLSELEGLQDIWIRAPTLSFSGLNGLKEWFALI